MKVLCEKLNFAEAANIKLYNYNSKRNITIRALWETKMFG